jgi:hypothetical protein
MWRIALAFRAFFAALLNSEKAAALQACLERPAMSKVTASVDSPQRPAAPPTRIAVNRNEAISLLAALQREARLVDLVKQPLAHFSDEQIGSTARTVLGDCQKVLDRFFALQPLTENPESSPCDVPAGYDPARYKLSGRVEGNGPFHGQLVHHGWQATTINLPDWTGSKDAALVIAPIEVEIP